MKIAYVSPFPPQVDGIGIYCNDLIKSLDTKIETKVFNEGFYWKRGGTLGPLAHNILEWKPDIIHIQHAYGFFPLVSEFVGFIKLLKDKKVVITLHEIPTYQHAKWYNDVDATFVFPHQEGLEFAQQAFNFKGDYEVIPLGATLFEAIPKELAREKLKLSDRFTLVQPGFYSYGKGMKELVQALSLLKQDEYDPILAFAGGVHPMAIKEDNKYLKETMQQIISLNLKDNILFTGKHLSEEELNLWISAADILVLNHQFVYGAISSSAMGKRIISSGKPCIFGNDPRLVEFKDGKTCLKVNPQDPTDVANKIKILAKDHSLGETLGLNAKEFADDMRWERIGKMHQELYERLLK